MEVIIPEPNLEGLKRQDRKLELQTNIMRNVVAIFLMALWTWLLLTLAQGAK